METRSPSAPSVELLRTTAVVGGAALLSRLLGFVRDMAMAWLLGPAADALVVALRLPHVLRRLLGEGSLSMTLTAAFTRGGLAAPPAPRELSHLAGLARAVGGRLACGLGLVVLAGLLFPGTLIRLLAPGLEPPQVAEQAAFLLRICLPYAFFAALAALHMALLHSMRRFLPPALSPALFNGTVLLFAALAALGLGQPAELLAWGVACGGLMQWLCLSVSVRRTGLWREITPPEPNAARDCLRRLPCGVLGAAAPQLAMLCAMFVASWLPHGSVSALYYAERLMELPLSVAGAALGIASLPSLAGLAAAGRHEAFARESAAALRLSLLVTLPAMTGLLAVAHPLVELLFARGAFDAQAVSATVWALCGYAPGLPAYGLTRPLLAACNARQRVSLTALSAALAVGMTLAVAMTLLHTLPQNFTVLGPPLGVSAGLWAQAALLWIALNRTLSVRVALPWSVPVRQLAASLVCGGAALWIRQALPHAAWTLFPAVAVGVAAYGAALWALDDEDFRALLRWKATRKGKGT